MIAVTRFDGTTLMINADLIEFVESRPDTVLTLSTGKIVLVQESPGDVVEAIVKYRQQILRGPILIDEATEEGN